MTTPANSFAEDLIEKCIPGGDICDPQQVADAIRTYCNRQHTTPTNEAREIAVALADDIGRSLYEHHGFISSGTIDELTPVIEARIAALLEDRKRLDWLEQHHKGHKISHSVQKGWRIFKGHLLIVEDKLSFRTAIDAAIRAEGGKE